jgi:hypothetical protein
MDERVEQHLESAMREVTRLLRERDGDPRLAAALMEIGDQLDAASRALRSRATARAPQDQLAFSR